MVARHVRRPKEARKVARKGTRWLVVAVLAAAVSTVGSTAAGQSSAEGKAPALVGRWQMLTTCSTIVRSLRSYGLEKLAPAMVAGNGLVDGTPAELAAKPILCKGAVPRVHSHFFTATGSFGSLDWNRQPVDDGNFAIIDGRSFRIGKSVFRYRILDGKRLLLTPVLTAAAKKKALAHPLGFSEAGWMVAVSMPAGGGWKRVPCAGWC
jgi:hypothetical protein